jgi:polysaccharide chain length determinant protein (PEP-CTERM system associated)
MQPSNQNDQSTSITRRAMDVEDYLDIARRHRSWILAPAFAGLVLAVVTAYLWPDSYRASGMIRVVPPKVPNRLVATNVNEAMAQRVASIYQDIISRSTLTNLIQTHNLYPDERKRLPMEDVVETMRSNINVNEVASMRRSSGAAYRVEFSYPDKRIAQKVCSDLISRFLDLSLSARSSQSLITTEFFRDQLEVVRGEIEEIDRRVAMLRARNAGQMPDQADALLNRINSLETSIQSINSSLNRVNQEKLQLETNLRFMREQAAAAVSGDPAAQRAAGGSGSQPRVDPRLAQVDAEVRRLESNLALTLERYRETHPDVQRVKGYLEAKRRERDELAREQEAAALDAPVMAADGAAPAPARRVPLELSRQMAQVQSSLQAKDMEMEDLNRQMNATRERIRGLQARLEASPAAQQEYIQLMRERRLVEERYNELANKANVSAMATDLENRKQSETLEILEQPIMPSEPYAPKREVIILGGLFIGLAIGVALASGRELKDTSLKNLKDVRAYTKLTVLGSIPLLENDFVVRRRRRLGWLAWAASFLLGVLLMAGAMVYYYTSQA